ncbi:MAG: uroporphyrinogen-III synthase [Campylobacteraceae bacterium]|nr:uroporphyrinogen-III synthase [Campylobacteraceae bacterium]
MSNIYLLNNQKHEGVINLKVFRINYLPFKADFSQYNALIFTSKNAITSLLPHKGLWESIDSYAIAPKTSEILLSHHSKLVFVGKTSHGNDFAKELIPLLKDKNVLYISAKKTVSNLVSLLTNAKINIKQQITYETVCSNEDKMYISKNAVIIFSSPSCIECFFKQYSWDKSYRAVLIGKTTASYFPSNLDYAISAKPNIKSCINLAKELYNK